MTLNPQPRHEPRFFAPVRMGAHGGPFLCFDPDPQGEGGGGGGKPPEDQPSSTTYPEEQGTSRMRGLNKQLAETQAKLKEIEDAKSKAAEEDAAKKGEFEKLFQKTKGELDTIKADLTTKAERLTAYEALLQGEVDSGIKAIEDKDTLKRWAELLKGRDLLDQRNLLKELMAATGQKPALHSPGAPGKPKPPDPKAVAKDPEARRKAALEMLQKGKS